LCAHMTIQHKFALLQGLYDLHRVLDSIDTGELVVVCETAAGWGLAPSVGLALLRVRQMFGTPLPPEVVRWSHAAAGEGNMQARVSALALGLAPADRPHDRMLDFMLKQSDESFFRFLFPSPATIRAQLG